MEVTFNGKLYLLYKEIKVVKFKTIFGNEN